WIMHRIWSTDWFKDRPKQIERLLRLIDEAKREVRALRAAAADNQARLRAEAERLQQEEQERASREEDARLATARSVAATGGYVRPTAEPYRLTAGHGRHAGTDIIMTPTGQL